MEAVKYMQAESWRSSLKDIPKLQGQHNFQAWRECIVTIMQGHGYDTFCLLWPPWAREGTAINSRPPAGRGSKGPPVPPTNWESPPFDNGLASREAFVISSVKMTIHEALLQSFSYIKVLWELWDIIHSMYAPNSFLACNTLMFEIMTIRFDPTKDQNLQAFRGRAYSLYNLLSLGGFPLV